MSISTEARTAETATIGRIAVALLLLRAIIGVVFIAHGSQKLFGAFGGDGLDAWTDAVAGMGVSPAGPLAFLGAVAELGGGVLLLLGLLTPLGSLAVIAMMLGAIKLQHGEAGFFAQNGGYEYNLTLIVIALALIATGPGRLSLDHQLGLELKGRELVRRLR